MEDKFIQVPTNVEDPAVLKRFITELVDKLNGNISFRYPMMYPTGYTGYIPEYYSEALGNYTNTILEAAARLDSLSGDAKNYISGNLYSEVLANSENIASIATQFGTFYDTSTAAAWYGLTVKAGELISGFTVGGVDSDTTTPGTAGSFFAINADTFSVGRALEDISDPAELAYVTANNLPYGTMYDATLGSIIPAMLIEWNGTSYDIFFNGKTEFNSYLSSGTTTIDGGKITANTITASQIAANTITASQIAADTITASQIAANAITTSELAANAVIAENILAGAVTANKISVTSLSAISANIGTITAGTINADVINAGVLNLAQIPALSNIVTTSSTTDITIITETRLGYVLLPAGAYVNNIRKIRATITFLSVTYVSGSSAPRIRLYNSSTNSKLLFEFGLDLNNGATQTITFDWQDTSTLQEYVSLYVYEGSYNIVVDAFQLTVEGSLK